MSGDPSKEYFSDGISEELLNQLSNVSELHVAARTSSFAFKGKDQDIRNIARALNVRTVVEGSVREDGQHIRITAQLINASNGYHLWSKTYDRDLRNILSLQDEIARAITVSLTHSLLGGSKPGPARLPIDPDAYRKYLEGQSFSTKKTVEDDARAIELLKEVIAAEPNFAPGFAALGRTYVHLIQLQPERSELAPAAQAALNEALRLDPRNLEALSLHLVLALMKWDWQKATDDAHRLQSLNPRSVFTLRALNGYYGSLGFSEQQAAALREATRLDPLSFVDLNNLATVYNARGEYAEAASAAGDALVLRPNRALALYTLCLADVGAKRFRDAQVLIGQLLALDEPGGAHGCSLKNAEAAGNRTETRLLADEMAKRFPIFFFDETDMGSFFLAAGEPAKAMMWFQRAYARRNRDLLALSYSATTPPSLLNMPAWKALMQQPEAQAWQHAHDRLATELAGE
jgi:TolB-like protein/cytochrome c-type biogenesis protein CcmH/NrfG